jgi:hypothetical protein
MEYYSIKLFHYAYSHVNQNWFSKPVHFSLQYN